VKLVPLERGQKISEGRLKCFEIRPQITKDTKTPKIVARVDANTEICSLKIAITFDG